MTLTEKRFELVKEMEFIYVVTKLDMKPFLEELCQSQNVGYWAEVVEVIMVCHGFFKIGVTCPDFRQSGIIP